MEPQKDCFCKRHRGGHGARMNMGVRDDTSPFSFQMSSTMHNAPCTMHHVRCTMHAHATKTTVYPVLVRTS